MKKLFNLFICLLLCFSFVTLANAEDGMDFEDSEMVDNDEDIGNEDFGDNEDFDDLGDLDDLDSIDNTVDNFESIDDDNQTTNEDLLNKDANVENSQTSDIPIILISSIAIISLIVVLSKKNNLVNSGF